MINCFVLLGFELFGVKNTLYDSFLPLIEGVALISTLFSPSFASFNSAASFSTQREREGGTESEREGGEREREGERESLT